MSRIILLIGTGGFLGSVARYFSQQAVTKFFPVVFPLGTLIVNVAGCFLIGIIYAVSDRGNFVNPQWRYFLATGFCGGFTTFSTFSYESLNLIKDGEFLYTGLYVALSVLLGFAATYFGNLVIKSI